MDNSIVVSVISGLFGASGFVMAILERRKRKAEINKIQAETKHYSAQDEHLIAEANKLKIETDNIISDGWKQLANAMKQERDLAFERIKELQIMLETENQVSDIKIKQMQSDHKIILNEIREQMKDERTRHDLRLNDLIKQILEFKK